jgi:hypothetical protein
MQACLESPALPLLEQGSLPLLEPGPGSFPLLDTAPAWTIRVARPTDPQRDELALELRGVPKAALRHVFGKTLGTRLWQQNRAGSTPAKPAPAQAISPVAPISDSEISGGMLRHLCTEAAATLREHKRLAKSISLTVSYSDRESKTVREPLLVASNDAMSLETAGRLALRGVRSHGFVSLKLNLTAMAAQA